MMAELSNPAEYSKMSILNLFSPNLNHKNRRKPVPRLALSPFVHFFNAQNAQNAQIVRQNSCP